MGDRCNLVIIENNQATVYYDHWAANCLHVELLWGPEIARAFIEEHDPNSNFWVNNSSSDGGCVVDFDTKHLLWYGGGDLLYEAELNLMHQDLMDIQWKGWVVEWAKDGIFDIAKKAGVSIDVVTYDGPHFDSETLSQPYTYEGEDYTFLYASNVVSFVDQGELHWAILNGDVECLGDEGLTPEKIAEIVRNFSESDYEKNRSIDPEWGSYDWGVHLNFDTLSLEYWNPNPYEGLEHLIKKRLPSWSVVFHGPNYLWHENVVPAKDWPVISRQKKLKQIEFYRQYLSQPRTNPLTDVIATLVDEGVKSIKVNPHAMEHRKGEEDLVEMKSAILDYLVLEVLQQRSHIT